MKIRKAKKRDLKKVAEIFRTEFNKEPYNGNWSKEKAFKKIREYNKRSLISIAEISNKIVGFIIYSKYLWSDGFRAEVKEIVISSKFQGKGIGTKLMLYVEDFYKKRGIKKILLMTHKKSKAFKIYKKGGFKETNLIEMEKYLK